jgi:hypothetical protein
VEQLHHRLQFLRLSWTYVGNTLVVGIISTIGTLITTIFAAFAFARLEFKGKNTIFAILLATMMIPGEMMVITNYITVANFGWLGNKVGAFTAMIVPFWISVFYIYLLRQNFLQIPNELYLAAKGRWQERLAVSLEGYGTALGSDSDLDLHSEIDGRLELLRLAATWSPNKQEWRLITNASSSDCLHRCGGRRRNMASRWPRPSSSPFRSYCSSSSSASTSCGAWEEPELKVNCFSDIGYHALERVIIKCL